MSVKEQILNDIKAAMKAGNGFERDTLRMINSAFKQIEVDERVELDDARIFSILQSEIKRRNESAAQYKSGGRDDLADKELGEIAIIARYLPKQLSDEELDIKIAQIISQNGLNGIKDLGTLMKLAKESIGSACDGKRMSEAAKKALS